MAEPSSAFGLRVVGHLHGAVPQVREYVIPSADGTATYIGDPVKTYGTADAVTGHSTVIQAAAGDTLRGVIVGITPITDSSNNLLINGASRRPASTRAVVQVCDDPYAIFEARCLSTGATTTHILAAADVGENCDIEVNSPSTVTGASGVSVDTSTHTASSAQLRILDVSQDDNNLANLAAAADYTRVRVLINEHELKSTSGV